ncbi:MAG: DUF721 domain-containing protein [Candidatus Bipolaricaulota bacterium]|nr:DUF721 domain-containing protein [Candidatus Bipolaricaulota bacterium]
MTPKDPWVWLEALARSWGSPRGLEEQEAVLRWGEMGLEGLARAMYVEDGILHLSVPSPVVAAELRTVQGKIVEELSRLAPRSAVTRLRFHLAAWPGQPREVAVPPPSREEVRRAGRLVPRGLPRPIRRAVAEALAWAEARDRAILAAGGWTCRQCELALLPEVERCPGCGMERPPRRG